MPLKDLGKLLSDRLKLFNSVNVIKNVRFYYRMPMKFFKIKTIFGKNNQLMKKLLLFAFVGILSIEASAQCTITSSCSVGANPYCSDPAVDGDLAPGTEGIAYSDVVQIATASSYMGATIQSAELTLNSAPAGLTVSFNPNTGTETECLISGGQSLCFTVYGTPTAVGLDQEVVIDVVVTVDFGGGPTPIPYTFTYYVDIASGTASLASLVGKSNFLVYPNPGNGTVMLTSSNGLHVVKNVLGQEISTVSVENGKAEINTSNWKNGVYFITNEQTGSSIKFIKK